MAAAQYGTAIFALGSPNGPRKSVRFYASDAAGGVTWPDGSTSTVLNGANDVYMVDFFTATAMSVVVTFTVFVGGVAEGTVIPTATNIGTTIGRQCQQAPVRIPRGASLLVLQA